MCGVCVSVVYCLCVWSLVLGQGLGELGRKGNDAILLHDRVRSLSFLLLSRFRAGRWEWQQFVKATAELSSKGAGLELARQKPLLLATLPPCPQASLPPRH